MFREIPHRLTPRAFGASPQIVRLRRGLASLPTAFAQDDIFRFAKNAEGTFFRYPRFFTYPPNHNMTFFNGLIAHSLGDGGVFLSKKY